jgi:hypothetical protein
MSVQSVLLWLFVINLGIVFGAGLYESRIVVPLWTSSPPESLRSPESGRRFWAFTSTIPLTLLTLANIAVAWQPHARREWWLFAAIAILVERIATFGYFIPAMLRMQRTVGSTTELAARIAIWERLNYVRLSLTFVAWLAALKALTLST